MLVSVRLSRLSQATIASRMGVSKQAFSKWLAMGIPGERVTAFCNVTGTSLLAQYHAMNLAYREASGAPRETDRIAQIAALAGAA